MPHSHDSILILDYCMGQCQRICQYK